MSLLVIHSGPASRVVDVERLSTRSLGVPVGGPADEAAWRLANALLGNVTNRAALEVWLMGARLRTDDWHFTCFFGRGFSLRVNGHFHSPLRAVQLSPGADVEIVAERGASCGYLCVAGGLDEPEVLNSRTGWAPLRAGQLLAARPSKGCSRWTKISPWQSLEAPLRVLPDAKTPAGLWSDFLGQEYVVSSESDRMGIRLQPRRPLPALPELGSSQPVCPGTIQLPCGGSPIILGKDAQTIGGYPRLGYVIAADFDRLAHLIPGSRVRFSAVSRHEAEALAVERIRWLKDWETRLLLNAGLWTTQWL